MKTTTRPSFESLSKPARAIAETAARNSSGVAFLDTAEQRAAGANLASNQWGVVRHLNTAAGSLCWFEHYSVGA